MCFTARFENLLKLLAQRRFLHFQKFPKLNLLRCSQNLRSAHFALARL